MRNLTPLLGLGAAALAAAFWFFNSKPPVAIQPPVPPRVEVSDSKPASPPPANPFQREEQTGTFAPDVGSRDLSPNVSSADTLEPKIQRTPDTLPETDARAYEIASNAQQWSDEQYRSDLARLRNDPKLLNAVVEEFLVENDPGRLRRLAMLLGNFDKPVVLQALREMINADAGAQKTAYRVLGRLQPRSTAARTLAIDTLQNSSQASQLVGAMNALSTVGNVTSRERNSVRQRATELSNHGDPAVRQRAVSTLANWTLDDSAVQVLVQGLADSDPAVRRTSAYAFVDYPHSNETVIETLLQRAEDPAEEQRTRRAAALVLRPMALSQPQRVRLTVAATQMER